MIEQEKLNSLKNRLNELNQELANPNLTLDAQKYQRVAKEHADIENVLQKAERLDQIQNQIQSNQEIASTGTDPELVQLAEQELPLLQEEKERLEETVQGFFVPKDPDDDKDVIIEIRAGTGGDEAELFASELFRMYARYAERKGWQFNIVSKNETPLGGIKEIIVEVKGPNAYRHLKYESGTHRVQRVPVTEKSGRIHTSAATVAVLPLVEKVDIQIKPEDLRIDVFRAGGHGGQGVNTTDSAVRITHLPTGMVVTCQDERSQLKNRDKAMKVLQSRLYELEKEAKQKERGDLRKSQIGSGDRSEKIRTYNFPQSRITDHRIQFTTHNFEQTLGGELDPLINALIEADQKKKLELLNQE